MRVVRRHASCLIVQFHQPVLFIFYPSLHESVVPRADAPAQVGWRRWFLRLVGLAHRQPGVLGEHVAVKAPPPHDSLLTRREHILVRARHREVLQIHRVVISSMLMRLEAAPCHSLSRVRHLCLFTTPAIASPTAAKRSLLVPHGDVVGTGGDSRARRHSRNASMSANKLDATFPTPRGKKILSRGVQGVHAKNIPSRGFEPRSLG